MLGWVYYTCSQGCLICTDKAIVIPSQVEVPMIPCLVQVDFCQLCQLTFWDAYLYTNLTPAFNIA